MLFSKLLKHYLIKGNFQWRKASAEKFWAARDKDFKEDYWVNLYHGDRSHHRIVICELVHLLTPSSIFEFGCSAAPNYRVISELGFDGKYDGVDINEEAIKFSKHKYGNDKVKFHLSSLNLIETISLEASHDLFLSVYSLAYLEYENCVKLLKNFDRTKVFIIAEPISKFQNSIFLNRIPEYAHNYDTIFESKMEGKFNIFRYTLPSRKNNLSTVSVYIRGEIL